MNSVLRCSPKDSRILTVPPVFLFGYLFFSLLVRRTICSFPALLALLSNPFFDIDFIVPQQRILTNKKDLLLSS